jgi:catechol 2,3-dioxygenase-like lactoylglutathione lyase family enzyme
MSTSPSAAALGRIWNLGLKVDDLEGELDFLERCGATRIERGLIKAPAGDHPFGTAFLGRERLLLFNEVVYADALPQPMQAGLAHAVYQVKDVARVVQRFAANGISPLWGPIELATPFGSRRVVFFRSPSGFVFETFEHLG